MNYWLVKQEPSSFSWDDFVKEGKTDWTGVRNYQARNFMQEMIKGDQVLFYHSGDEKQIVGIAEVTREYFEDPTADDPRWIAVELKPLKPLGKPVTLSAVKQEGELQDIHLVRNSRLSVMPLEKPAYDLLLKMSK